MVVARSVADGAPTSDATALAGDRGTADSAGTADSVSDVLTAFRTVPDDVPVTDAVSVTLAGSSSTTTADDVPTADTATATAVTFHAAADTTPTSDSTALDRVIAAANSVPTADAVSRVQADARTTADVIPTGDALTWEKSTGHTANAGDDVPLSDASTLTRLPGPADLAPVTDAVATLVVASRDLADPIPAVDSPAAGRDIALDPDLVPVIDDIYRSLIHGRDLTVGWRAPRTRELAGVGMTRGTGGPVTTRTTTGEIQET